MHGPEKLDEECSANEDSNVSVELETSISPNGDLQEGNDSEKNLGSSNALGNGLSSMLINIIRDFDSKADDTLKSQNQLSSSLDRLTTELDQLLEDAPFPFIMQHASRISNVRKRVLSLNSILRSIQRRVDNMDRAISMGNLPADIPIRTLEGKRVTLALPSIVTLEMAEIALSKYNCYIVVSFYATIRYDLRELGFRRYLGSKDTRSSQNSSQA